MPAKAHSDLVDPVPWRCRDAGLQLLQEARGAFIALGLPRVLVVGYVMRELWQGQDSPAVVSVCPWCRVTPGPAPAMGRSY